MSQQQQQQNSLIRLYGNPKKGSHSPYGSSSSLGGNNGWGNAYQSNNNSYSHDNTTESSSTNTVTTTNERSPLVTTKNKTTSTKTLVTNQNVYLARVNHYSLNEKIQPLVQQKVEDARRGGHITFVLYAFTLMHGERDPVAVPDSVAFEHCSDNVLARNGSARAISLQQLGVDIMEAPRIYTEVACMLDCLVKGHPDITVVVKKEALKQRVPGSGFLGRFTDSYQCGYYYKIIGDFALIHCINNGALPQ
jgi:hypothetical protein